MSLDCRRLPIRRLLLPAILSVAVASPSMALAQVARVELIPFPSATLTDQEFLAGLPGKPVTIAGELRIPKPGAERLPAVIVVHGSGGITGSVDAWATLLNSNGIATFVFDSFTPRGIVNTLDDQDQLGRLAMIVDAYRALAVLSKHPRVDPAKITLLGFSRGGQATLYASLERFRRMYGPTDAGFSAFIAFYPECGTRYLNDETLADRPVRIFHGTDDDYASVAPCRSYAERLVKAGKDVALTEYSGAYHFFDAATLKAPLKLPNAQTVRHCPPREEVEGGRVVNTKTGQPFTYKDPCVERGVTLAHDARAATEAQQAVLKIIANRAGAK